VAARPEPSLVRGGSRAFPSLSAAARFAHAFTECDGIAKEVGDRARPAGGGPTCGGSRPYAEPGPRHGHRHGVGRRRPKRSSCWWPITAARGHVSAARPRMRAKVWHSARRRACSRSMSSPGTTTHAARHPHRPDHHPICSFRFAPANNLELVGLGGRGRFPRRGCCCISSSSAASAKVTCSRPAAGALHHA